MGCLGRKAIIEKFSPNKIALQNVDIYQDTINKFNLKKFFQNMQTIEKVPYGIANFVYKIETKENVYIAKCYREGMKKNNLSPIIYNKSIHEFLITSNILENENMTIMNHIQGSHQDILTDEEINVVFDFIKYFHAKDYEVEMLKDKIANFSLQSYSKRDDVQQALSNFWQENSIQIERILSSDLVVSHGDLSSTNILLSNQTIAFLDFDELCLAPKYYDLAVFIVKHCFINGEWNNVYAEKIKNLYQLKNQDFNDYDFNFTILLYL